VYFWTYAAVAVAFFGPAAWLAIQKRNYYRCVDFWLFMTLVAFAWPVMLPVWVYAYLDYKRRG